MADKSFVIRLDNVEAGEREFSLVKASDVLAVEPRAFWALQILVRNSQKLISMDNLLNAVWGDTAVSENSLARSIALLCSLVGDDTPPTRVTSKP